MIKLLAENRRIRCGLFFVLLFVANNSAASENCDRACIQQKVDQYVRALVAHDPSIAPLAKTVRSTQNGEVIQSGEGVWQRIAAQESYRQTFIDETLQSAVFFGAFQDKLSNTLSSTAAPLLLAVRFAFKAGEITELEHLISIPDSRNRLILNHKLTEPNPVYEQLLPKAERRSRTELIGLAQGYFDGLQNNTDDGVMMDRDCNRRENGVLLLKNPDPKNQPCPIGFNRFNYITDIRDRRVAMVDTARGLVLMWAFFDVPGNVEVTPGRWGPSDLSTTVGERVDTRKIPRSLYIAELFRVVDGNIRDIEAIMFNLDLGTTSGWQ